MERRKQRVIDVASELLMQKGYAETSIAAITRLARVSPRMIAAHFGDKTGVFSEVVNQRVTRHFPVPAEVDFSAPLADILFDVAKSVWTAMYQPDSIRSHRLLVAEGERFGDQTRQIAKRSADEFYAVVEKVFVELHARGMIKRNEPVKSARYFVDLINGVALAMAAVGYQELIPGDEDIRDKVDLFCRGWLNVVPGAAEAPSEPTAKAGHRPRGSTLADLNAKAR